MATYKLTYFPGRGGGEICRLTMAAAGVEFDDERISGEDWQKKKPDTPMKAMPILTIKADGEEIIYCQSAAIARYFAREYNLMGSTKVEHLLVDEVYDSVTDTLRELYKVFFEKDEAKKEEGMKSFKDLAIPKFADYFDKRKKKFGSDGYVIGSKLSLADIAVFNFVDGIVLRENEDFFKGCDSMMEHYKFIKKNPKISGWLAKRPETKF